MKTILKPSGLFSRCIILFGIGLSLTIHSIRSQAYEETLPPKLLHCQYELTGWGEKLLHFKEYQIKTFPDKDWSVLMTTDKAKFDKKQADGERAQLIDINEYPKWEGLEVFIWKTSNKLSVQVLLRRENQRENVQTNSEEMLNFEYANSADAHRRSKTEFRFPGIKGYLSGEVQISCHNPIVDGEPNSL
jgi:hypothetical protein